MGMSIWSATERSAAVVSRRVSSSSSSSKHGFLNVDRPPGLAGREGRLARVHAKTRRAVPASHPARARACMACAARPTSVRRAHRAAATERFDHVFFACHATRRCGMLEDPTPSRARGARRLSLPGKRGGAAHRRAPAAAHAAGARRLELSILLDTRDNRDARSRRPHLRHERAAVARCAGEVPGHAQSQRGHRSRAKMLRPSPITTRSIYPPASRRRSAAPRSAA